MPKVPLPRTISWRIWVVVVMVLYDLVNYVKRHFETQQLSYASNPGVLTPLSR